MGLAFRRHLRTPVDKEPERKVRELLANREPNFLGLVRAPLENPAHPYSQLFAQAGCTYGDLANEVRRNGLEPTLSALLAEGVYLTHDEFRGREPIVRRGRTIKSKPSDWLNHFVKGEFTQQSSGSSGQSVITTSTLAHLAHIEAALQLCARELQIAGRRAITVAPILPGFGMISALLTDRLGLPYERWYAVGGGRGNAHYRWATRYIITQLRLSGANIPYPIYIEKNDWGPVARYLAEIHSQGSKTALGGFVSTVTRVAAAAIELGIDLTGCCAMMAGEALTDAKRKVMEDAGMVPYPTYGATETGTLGYPCRAMNDGNRVHVYTDGVALITRPTSGGLDCSA